jgi:hypothetical protein
MTKKQFVALADSIREHNRVAKYNGKNPFTNGQLRRVGTLLRSGESAVQA